MLQEGVLRVCCSETFLVGVGEVDVVEGEGYYGEGVGGVAEGVLQCRDQDRLASTLNPIQPQKQWRGLVRVRSITRLVGFYAVEEEGDAVLGFVVDDFGHGAGYSGSFGLSYVW